MPRKINIIMREGREVPLIPADSVAEQYKGNFNHMLREADHSRVKDVVEFLYKNGGIVSYLGGGVTEGFLYHGKRNYTDIDILGLCNEQGNDAAGLSLVLARAGSNGGIIIGKNAFNVKHLTGRLYFNLHNAKLRERLILTPLMTYEELKELNDNRPAEIDLSLVSVKDIEKL